MWLSPTRQIINIGQSKIWKCNSVTPKKKKADPCSDDMHEGQFIVGFKNHFGNFCILSMCSICPFL